MFGSPGYPESLDVRLAAARARTRAAFDRPASAADAAVIADGSRVDRLRAVNVPTLVIHGADDPLIPVAAGRDTAAVIPGARLEDHRRHGPQHSRSAGAAIVEIVTDFLPR